MAKKEAEQGQAAEATTDVAVAQGTALQKADLSEWGNTEMSGRDLVIPKLLMQQSTSELVGDGKAKLGDVIDNTTFQVMGSVEKPLLVIPFHMERVWIISSREAGKGDTKFEFEKYEAVTPQNANYPFTEIVTGREFKYEYTMQFYVLLENDPTLPYVLAFKSTSQRAGKVMSTQMYVRNKAAGLTPAGYVMEVSTRKDKNEKGTYAVMDVKPSKKSTNEQVASCLEWLKIVKAGATKVAAETPGARAAGNDAAFASDNVPF